MATPPPRDDASLAVESAVCKSPREGPVMRTTAPLGNSFSTRVSRSSPSLNENPGGKLTGTICGRTSFVTDSPPVAFSFSRRRRENNEAVDTLSRRQNAAAVSAPRSYRPTRSRYGAHNAALRSLAEFGQRRKQIERRMRDW